MEIVYEMRLIVIATGECKVGPVEICSFANRLQHALEAEHAAKHFGC